MTVSVWWSRGEVYSDITLADIFNKITRQMFMIPRVIMIIIVMVGSIAISSISSDKENKTLETPLTMPIKRTSIVSGKIVIAAVVELVYMVGMNIYMGSMADTIAGSFSVSLKDLACPSELSIRCW